MQILGPVFPDSGNSVLVNSYLLRPAIALTEIVGDTVDDVEDVVSGNDNNDEGNGDGDDDTKDDDTGSDSVEDTADDVEDDVSIVENITSGNDDQVMVRTWQELLQPKIMELA